MAEHRYAWQGNDRNGRTLRGEWRAQNTGEVVSHLQAQRIRPIRITRQYDLPIWLRQGFNAAIPAQRLPTFTRQFATLFGAGIPLADALESVQGVTGNMLFDAATRSMQAQLMQGISLSQALDSSADLFPPMVAQMCAIGEESGALDHMLNKTAEHFEAEVDRTVTRLSTLLEPFIMVVLGVLIGGLVMALYLPIFQLGQVV